MLIVFPAAQDALDHIAATNDALANRLYDWLDALEADPGQSAVRRHPMAEPGQSAILVEGVGRTKPYAILWRVLHNDVAVMHIGTADFSAE